MADGGIHTVKHRHAAGQRLEVALAVGIGDVGLAAGDDNDG